MSDREVASGDRVCGWSVRRVPGRSASLSVEAPDSARERIRLVAGVLQLRTCRLRLASQRGPWPPLEAGPSEANRRCCLRRDPHRIRTTSARWAQRSMNMDKAELGLKVLELLSPLLLAALTWLAAKVAQLIN